MEEIELQLPAARHQAAAEEFREAFFRRGERVINGSALLDQMEYGLWLENTRRNRSADTVRDDWVVADTFFAVRLSDGKIVGMVDIRHSLDHDFLRQYGGHIGYAVRPEERRKGYAAAMLRLGLAHARSLGLERVMLGCYADNLPSIRTIEKCGGILAETKPYADGRPMRVYWIALETLDEKSRR